MRYVCSLLLSWVCVYIGVVCVLCGVGKERVVVVVLLEGTHSAERGGLDVSSARIVVVSKDGL